MKRTFGAAVGFAMFVVGVLACTPIKDTIDAFVRHLPPEKAWLWELIGWSLALVAVFMLVVVASLLMEIPRRYLASRRRRRVLEGLTQVANQARTLSEQVQLVSAAIACTSVGSKQGWKKLVDLVTKSSQAFRGALDAAAAIPLDRHAPQLQFLLSLVRQHFQTEVWNVLVDGPPPDVEEAQKRSRMAAWGTSHIRGLVRALEEEIRRELNAAQEFG